MEDFIAWAKINGWILDLSQHAKNLPDAVTGRYPNIPEAYADFVSRINACHNANETAWFISPEGFAETDPNKWRYNEFELLSLEAAADNDEWRKDITEFWDRHLPIALSVVSGYSYYAISMEDGCIVRGFEPEFEETQVAADSFADFQKKIISGIIEL